MLGRITILGNKAPCPVPLMKKSRSQQLRINHSAPNLAGASGR